jgi:FkbM family methyltransferase
MSISYVANQFVLAYVRHFPIEFGKWRLRDWLAPRTANMIATIQTVDRFKMRLDTSDFIQRSIFLTGRWDEDVARIIRTTLKADDVFIDVGANVGYFSLLAARLCKRVISFEPNQNCLEQLVANVGLNDYRNIDIRNVGLAEERRSATFYIRDARNMGGGSLRQGGNKTFSIELNTLDEEIGELVPRLIKMDIEGAELLALKGAKRLLSVTNAPDVICEISEFSLRQLGTSKEELFATMNEYGYRYRIISAIRKSSLTDTTPFFQYDVLFFKDRASTK